jgi:hypothetical protein
LVYVVEVVEERTGELKAVRAGVIKPFDVVDISGSSPRPYEPRKSKEGHTSRAQISQRMPPPGRLRIHKGETFWGR